jgi:hypothetical protein
MNNDFPGLFTPTQIWLKGLVGRYNWLETTFPGWVYTVALLPAALIITLALRTLVANRPRLRERTPELATYAAIALGVLVVIAADSYLQYPQLRAGVSEPRYLLPLLAPGAAIFALAARGARRFGPAIGTLLIMLVFTDDILSQMLEITRYFG